MHIYLQALGCRLNEAELETWAREFQRSGHTLTAQPEVADLVVLNSCAVTAEAVRKSRQLIRRTHRVNPQAKLVLTGCFATLEETSAAALAGVDLVIPNADKEHVVEIALNAFAGEEMPSLASAPGEASLFARRRNRAFVKIQDGCRWRCTFCIVTLARGDERSRPITAIVDEIKALVVAEVKEVVLTGVHAGGYGSDLGTDLAGLIARILDETEIERLRLGSLEPWDLPAQFFELFSNSRLMPHLHLPLQSGNDAVLKRMARRCKTSEFIDLVNTARVAIPNFNVTTDIIVGFPGETETEWSHSLTTIEAIGFSHVHIFPYSPRPGTKAAELPGQVAIETRKARSRELHKLAQHMKTASLANAIGRQVEVLVEHSAPTGSRATGYTPNYLKVDIDAEDLTTNQIVPVQLVSVQGDRLTGTLT